MQDPFITADLLDEYGITVKPEEVESLLAELNKTLEERVGTEITESLNDEQLQELIKLQETGSDEQVGRWIDEHVTDLKEITQDEIDILLGELAENAEAITSEEE